MGLEPEGDSTVVWRHPPVDTKKEMPVTKMKIKCNGLYTQCSGIKE